LVAERRPAFVLVNHLHLYPAVADLTRVPFVLREHNVEFSWMTRYAENQGLTPQGIFARLQALRLRAVEAEACRKAGLVLAIQPHEADLLRRLAAGPRVEELPIGIDYSRFRPPRPVDPPIVLLAGSFAWPPNAEGAIRFLREGWPRIRKEAPSARLRLAGKDPPERLAQEAQRA